jgi:hypothetical protein
MKRVDEVPWSIAPTKRAEAVMPTRPFFVLTLTGSGSRAVGGSSSCWGDGCDGVGAGVGAALAMVGWAGAGDELALSWEGVQ